jgi:hypothetical protein
MLIVNSDAVKIANPGPDGSGILFCCLDEFHLRLRMTTTKKIKRTAGLSPKN